MIFVKYCYLFYSCKLLEKWDKSNNDVKISMSNKLRKILMNQRNMITLLFVTMKHNYLDFVDLNIFLATKIRSDYKTIVQFLLTKDLYSKINLQFPKDIRFSNPSSNNIFECNSCG